MMKKPNAKWTLIVGIIIIALVAVWLTNSIGSAQNTPNSNSKNPQVSTSIQGLNNTTNTIISATNDSKYLITIIRIQKTSYT